MLKITLLKWSLEVKGMFVLSLTQFWVCPEKKNMYALFLFSFNKEQSVVNFDYLCIDIYIH